MRWWASAFIVLLIAPAQGIMVIDDPAGDMELAPFGGPGTPNYTPADLLALDIEETPLTFRFSLSVMPPTEPDVRSIQDAVEWRIHFNVGAVAYEIQVYDSPTFGSSDWVRAYLYRADRPGEGPYRIAGLDAHYAPEAGNIVIEVDRSDLRDENGIEPVAGTDLSYVTAESQAGFYLINIGTTPGPYDRMPDRGDAPYAVRLGAAQTGHATLSTEDRLRASNGAATTYFFDVNLTNHADYPDSFALSLGPAPSTWQVRLPYDSVEVPANSSVRFPLLATIPFQHAHGAIETFLLEAISDKDLDTVGRIELGVEFLEVPQPAGHHDTVFLHGRGGPSNYGVTVGGPVIAVGTTRTIGWMNSMPDDPRSAPDLLYGQWAGLDDLQDQVHGWVFPLDPYLRLGLDFDLEAIGSIAGTVGSDIALSDVWLDGRILSVGRGNVTSDPSDYEQLAGSKVLADILPTDVRDLSQGDSASFEAAVQATPLADLVPPTRDENMVLVLWLHGTGIPSVIGVQDRAWLEPGTTMRLPLFEYHDPIDEAFAAPDFIHIDAQGPVERFAAPGGKVLYELRLQNDGIQKGTFELTAYGTNADWVEFPAGTTFTVPPTDEVIMPIAVAPPAGIERGETADVVIEAVAREDERMRGLIRLSTIVDGDRATAVDTDDTVVVEAIEAENQESPAAWLPIVFVALLGVALRARRL